MAQAMIKDTKLRLVFESGVNEMGNPIYKSKTYSNVKKESTADQLSQAAKALASLCDLPLANVERNNSEEIVG